MMPFALVVDRIVCGAAWACRSGAASCTLAIAWERPIRAYVPWTA
jgi:hypothetical protein